MTSEDDDGPHNESFLMEHIKVLSAIMSQKWLAEMELSTEVARIIAPLDVLTCILKKTNIEAHYSPTVGMNIISKALAKNFAPTSLWSHLIGFWEFLQELLLKVMESWDLFPCA